MGVLATVREIMALDCLAGAKVLSGEKGLFRVVSGASIMEVPDIWNWVKEGALLLTTLYPVKDSPEAQVQLPIRCAEKGIAAIAIKPGRFCELHPQMLANAEKCGLPLIQIPFNLAFADILYPVMKYVLDQQGQNLERSLSIQNAITEKILAGGNVDDLAQVLSSSLQNVVSIHDEKNHCLSVYNGTGQAGLEEVIKKLIKRAPKTEFYWNLGEYPAYKYVSLNAEQQDFRYVEQPIIGGSQILGFLRVWELGRKLTDADLAVVKQSSTLLAVERMKFLSSKEVEKKYRQRFLQELLQGQVTSLQALLEAAQFLEWDFSGARTAVAIKVQANKAVDLKNMLKFIDSAAQGLDPRLITGLMEEHMVILWPVDQQPAACLEGRLAKLLEIIRKEYKNLHLAAGVGSCKDSPLQLHVSFREALQALNIGLGLRQGPVLTFYDQLKTYRVLFHVPPEPEVLDFLRETIGLLLHHDREHGTELVKTLEVFFIHNGNESQMARDLFIHYNTVRNRLQRISEVCRLDLKQPEDRFSLELALRLYKLRHWPGISAST